MLNHLDITNFTTVEQIELEFNNGLTSITGETGAGKSVMLDALALALGARNTGSTILRNEKLNAEITACFTLPEQSPLALWLEEKELTDNEKEIILRRIVKPDGRSRAFINGRAVSLNDLKHAGTQLVDLHGQHEHQSLLNRNVHQQLVDNFADNSILLDTIKTFVDEWNTLEKKIADLKHAGTDREAKRQLLAYQVQELDKLALEETETSALEAEQKILANAETLMHNLATANQLCTGGNSSEQESNILSMSRQTIDLIKRCTEDVPSLKNCADLLESASIQIEEAASDISHTAENIKIDPERLHFIDDRLDKIYSIARKHNLKPNQLFELHNKLKNELNELENGEHIAEQLQQEQKKIQAKFKKVAGQLSKKRSAVATSLTKKVMEKLALLNMKHCAFNIQLNELKQKSPNNNGHETIEFLISTVPGKPPQPLSKIASGGELSRISLAIQVVTAQAGKNPTLVFDEVDVGIGGGTAEVVGNLLRELGSACQVLCVTHLAQVAAKGNQHLLVSKEISKSTATTQFDLLDNTARKAELARMISGIDVTESTLAHASELLETAE